VGFAIFAAAAALLAGVGAVAARVFPPPRSRGDRAVFAGLLAVSVPIATVRLLSPFFAIGALPVLAATFVLAAIALLVVGENARRRLLRDARAIVRLGAKGFVAGSAAPLAWIGLVALGLAAAAAWRYAPWAWDALGYHLPIVTDAIATHTLRTVPTNIPYINAYPRAVETFFVAFRALLPNDTWIDFAQVPFGVLACVAIAAFARRAGVPAARAVAFGIAFLAVPLVMLQLATDYVDVAAASLLAATVYFATSPQLAPADLVAWTLAAGLLLGSKPSMPPVVALLALLMAIRTARARGIGFAAAFTLASSAGILALGGATYLTNLVAHGNPTWPIALDFGPLHLPGEDHAGPLMLQGLPPDLAQASWARRVLVSLFVEPREYIYDMRLGGLGPLARWGLVPLAMIAAVRAPRRALPALLLGVCALATPAAHWMRYALAFPLALLALAPIAIGFARPKVRGAIDVALAALAVIGLVRALPGLRAGDGGVDGREALWDHVRANVGPGESFAYDASFSLPGQLTCADGRAGAPVYLGAAASADEVDRAITNGRARVVVAGDTGVSREAVERANGRYRLAFRCPLDPCDVFVRERSEPFLSAQ
jgi:hypothetical protein